MDLFAEGATRRSVRDKISGYLFNKDNPDGWAKGEWFRRALGFNPEDREHLRILEKQIRFDGETAIFARDTQWGRRWRQEISITGPDGKVIHGVRSIWQKDIDTGIMRLVTIMPPKMTGGR